MPLFLFLSTSAERIRPLRTLPSPFPDILPQFCEVRSYRHFGAYHVFGYLASTTDIVVHEIEHHIGIVHGGAAISLFCKAIVVVPRLHGFNQFVSRMMKLTSGTIVIQHFANILFRKSCQFVELRRSGIVGADVETAGQIVHGYRADTRHETTFNGRISLVSFSLYY